MVNKKSASIIFASLVFLSLFAFVVSAQTTSSGPNAFFRSITADLKEFFVRFADYRNPDNNNLTVTVLLSFLVFMVIGSIVNIIPLFAKRGWLPRTLISLVVTALSVMLIPREILALAINPYSALGIVIITVIPFIFMFTFVHATIRNVFFRRAIWMLFVLSFLILGLYNLFGDSTSDAGTWYSIVYFVGCLLAAGMIWKGEELEYAIFKGEVAKGEASGRKYLAERKLQMEFDRQRAAVELGIDDDSKLSRRKLS